MVGFEYTITDKMGLHMRPAGMMVKMLKEAKANVTVRCGSREADGKKLFQMLGMVVKYGETVEVEIDGEGEQALLDGLLDFFQENL